MRPSTSFYAIATNSLQIYVHIEERNLYDEKKYVEQDFNLKPDIRLCVKYNYKFFSMNIKIIDWKIRVL